LKQIQSVKRDLEEFTTYATATTTTATVARTTTRTPALQGQISASLTALTRTIDDYDALARRELISAKKEKAIVRVKEFRTALAELRTRFEELKSFRVEGVDGGGDRDGADARLELMGRRMYLSATPENPYANVQQSSMDVSGSHHPFVPSTSLAGMEGANIYRERDFLGRADLQLDEFLDRGRAVLENLTEQRTMLKATQRRLYSVANTLGISADTIRMVERRAMQDKWFFYSGVVVFFVFCFVVVRFLG
jgi:Golgi SNAP receptor complex protein 2